MNENNLISLADRPPDERHEIAVAGGKASGITRARKAYLKAVARELILRKAYFDSAAESTAAEWAEFQQWKKRMKHHANSGKGKQRPARNK